MTTKKIKKENPRAWGETLKFLETKPDSCSGYVTFTILTKEAQERAREKGERYISYKHHGYHFKIDSRELPHYKKIYGKGREYNGERIVGYTVHSDKFGKG